MNIPPGYTYIASISELDPNKIPITQSGKKFIDKLNQRFMLKFNKATSKMEIVQLFQKSELDSSPKPVPNLNPPSSFDETKLDLGLQTKEPVKEELSFVETTTNPTPKEFFPEPEEELHLAQNENPSSAHQIDLSNIDLDISKPRTRSTEAPPVREIDTQKSKEIVDTMFEKNTILELFIAMNSYKSRINAAITNLINSKVVDSGIDTSQAQNFIIDIQKSLKEDVYKPLETGEDLFEELTTYPRSIPMYISKFQPDRREKIQKEALDENKILMIIRFEMQDLFSNGFSLLKRYTFTLLDNLNKKPDEHIKSFPTTQQNLFQDARKSILYITMDMEKTTRIIEGWLGSYK